MTKAKRGHNPFLLPSQFWATCLNWIKASQDGNLKKRGEKVCLKSLKVQETTVWLCIWVGVSMCVCAYVCVVCVIMYTRGCEGCELVYAWLWLCLCVYRYAACDCLCVCSMCTPVCGVWVTVCMSHVYVCVRCVSVCWGRLVGEAAFGSASGRAVSS